MDPTTFQAKYRTFIKDGLFAWTLTSNGYKYLTWNMALHWKKNVKDVQLCVLCSDKSSYQFLNREGIRCMLVDTVAVDYGPQIVPFGSRQFSTLNRLKLRLLRTFASDTAVQQCLYLDGDIVVYKDIVADIRQRLTEGSLWMPCDEQQHTCSSYTLQAPCPNYCSGLIAWNHGADQGIFAITDETVWAAKPEDQVWVNTMLNQKNVPVCTLSRLMYPNGARLTLTKQTPELAEQAVCLHYNYRVGTSKYADMKRFGDWLLVQCPV